MLDKGEEETQNLYPKPLPLATSQISSNMSRYEAIKVPILKAHEYPIWKVRMAMCLEATDPEYLSMIYDGPHKPMKVDVSVARELEKMIDNDMKDYTPEDISSIMQDAKKNRRRVLTQEYEHFDSRDNESLTEIYDRFQKLLNDLSLVNKEHDFEDSNLKFLLALPEKWDFKVTSIRDNNQFNITPLDEIYGVLKTHELEMEQRSKRKKSKSRPVALKVEEKPKEKARRKSYSKGKTMISKSNTVTPPDPGSGIRVVTSITFLPLDLCGYKATTPPSFPYHAYVILMMSSSLPCPLSIGFQKFPKIGVITNTESSNSDDDSNPDTKSDTDSDHNNNEDMDKMAALLRNNRRDTDWKEVRFGKSNKSKERCYNCDGLGHFAADCRKPRAKKKQALISRKRNWDDSSDSDDRINYVLMENIDAETNKDELKVPQSTFAFDIDDSCELKIFLKNIHVSFRGQTLENNIIKSENFVLKKRNDYLETELLSMLEIQ
ncbi:hypothetical protein AgCh_038310 [Apium graveolens]